MKIAMIGQKGIPASFGGVERHVEELAPRLVKRGHKVTVYVRPHYTMSKMKSFCGVKLISLPSFKTKHFDAISHTLFATIHALFQDYDIIHYHSGGPSLVSWIPRIFRPRIKIIATFHSLERLHQKWGLLARLILRLGEWTCVKFPHQTITVSKYLKQYCLDMYGKDTVYIPNGVSVKFTKSRAAKKIKKDYGLMTDQYILTVSRLIPTKGIHYLIEAYKKLKTRKSLVIVGDSAYTDDYVKRLYKLADNDPRIIFTGFQKGKSLSELYSNTYLFVLPSEVEGLPVSLLEAAGFGKRTLTSDIPANLEIVKVNDQVIGYTFRNKSINDLSKKLDEIIKHPKSTQKTGKLARTVVHKEFNWHKIARETENLYIV
ncbi:glycosyltransferase family 4 protein [Patescibacteria group bacterium]|nr:glycosyltransferase family 4 protein [Patescibacteria group bacterium]MBU1891111.1 glycosyltransferase family 4 protein [Patescibacteria group bacterium]